MGLFDYTFTKKSALAERDKQIQALSRSIADLKLAVEGQSAKSNQIEQAIKERRRTLSRPLHYRTTPVGSDIGDRKDTNHIYYGPGYDLAEIGRAIDVEPYVNQSVRKHREQILKEGWSIKCDDDEVLDYIYKRLFEMALVSGITTDQWLREFTTNLIGYATSFLVVKRDSNRSSGKSIRLYGKDREPMAAVFPMDPTTVSVALNEYGHPVRWRQRLTQAIGDKKEIVFDADDVITATIDKKTGFVFGTPYILPTLDDVRSLRRLEEYAELLGQRHCFPLLHFQVGTELLPAQVFEDGSDEVSLVKSLVENMPTEGGIVTSNRVVANLLGGDKQTLDLVPYLEYFESRVLGGLRLSEIDLGRGNTSRASAVTVSQGLQDSARDFQAIISDVITHQLLLPLALEGGFDIDPNENMPSLAFETIDREEQRANQMHGQDLYLGGTITHDEFRRDYLSKKPCQEGEKCNLKPERDHEMNKEVQQIAGEQAIQKAKVSKSQTAIKNKTANKSRPANQHGKKKTKTRVTKNSLDLLSEAYFNNVNGFLMDSRATLWDIVKNHQGGVVADGDPTDVSTKDEQITAAFDYFIATATIEARKALDPIIHTGAKDAMADMEIMGDFELSKKHLDRFHKNYIEKQYRALVQSAVNLINDNDGLAGINADMPAQFYITSIFEQVQNELNSLCHKHIDTAYRVGYARAARSHGHSSVKLMPDSDGWFCEDCEEMGPITVSLVDKNGSYASILSTHDKCSFVITVDEK